MRYVYPAMLKACSSLHRFFSPTYAASRATVAATSSRRRRSLPSGLSTHATPSRFSCSRSSSNVCTPDRAETTASYFPSKYRSSRLRAEGAWWEIAGAPEPDRPRQIRSPQMITRVLIGDRLFLVLDD